MTRKRLERSALAYLQRFSSSEANLRSVLQRKAKRSCEAHETDMEEVREWIHEVIETLREQGLLNDRRYAEGLIRRLRRRGSSTRMIAAKLREKGIAPGLAELILNEVSEPGEDLQSACAFARRRRFGPFGRDDDPNPDRRRKELASFARAGFSREHAERVLAAENVHALEEICGAGPEAWG